MAWRLAMCSVTQATTAAARTHSIAHAHGFTVVADVYTLCLWLRNSSHCCHGHE